MGISKHRQSTKPNRHESKSSSKSTQRPAPPEVFESGFQLKPEIPMASINNPSVQPTEINLLRYDQSFVLKDLVRTLLASSFVVGVLIIIFLYTGK